MFCTSVKTAIFLQTSNFIFTLQPYPFIMLTMPKIKAETIIITTTGGTVSHKLTFIQSFSWSVVSYLRVNLRWDCVKLFLLYLNILLIEIL